MAHKGSTQFYNGVEGIYSFSDARRVRSHRTVGPGKAEASPSVQTGQWLMAQRRRASILHPLPLLLAVQANSRFLSFLDLSMQAQEGRAGAGIHDPSVRKQKTCQGANHIRKD